LFILLMCPRPPRSPLFPYTTLFRSALTRWRFGRKRRLVIAVTWVPIPPCFLGLPLRQMMLPLIGPLPVNSQIRAITNPVLKQGRSEEHTSELQSRGHLVCRLLLEKK